MLEPAAAPLLCREAAQGVSSGASPILGGTDVPSVSSLVLAAGQQAGEVGFWKAGRSPTHCSSCSFWVIAVPKNVSGELCWTLKYTLVLKYSTCTASDGPSLCRAAASQAGNTKISGITPVRL